ncbi:MAG TPA: dihydrofolate reductase family protein [Caulobacterales bacterium]|nr:dihydrofolate reductase family protein [Caulobacterales bacterium]
MTVSPRRIAYLAVSADGLIADRHGQVGWLERFGGAADFGFDDFVAHIDALLMGRRTFDQITAFGGAWPYGARPTLVLTHRPLAPNAPASARGAGEEDVTQALLGAPGRIWIVGGGETLAFCLRRGLVDELQLFVMPILLGEGAPLTGRLHKNVDLILARTETLARGVTKLTYTVDAKAAAHHAEAAADTPPPETAPSQSAPANAATDREALAPYPPEANAEQDA